jgi:peptidoglycan/xylan/chitin deacetylase (PgdA/CDA1 family)
MLTFGKSNTILFAGLLTMNILQFFISVSGWWYLGLTGVYITLISIGSFRVNSNFHFPVYCSNTGIGKGVAITFDDGPDPEITPRILEVLRHHQAKAAFFMIAEKAESQPELVKQVIAEGHIIGNHTYGHSYWFDFFPPFKMLREFVKSEEVIKKITGKSIIWFRPPYGVTNPMMKRALKKSGFAPIGWSIRSLDTVIKDPEKVIERVKKSEGGDIILLHETRSDMPEILGRVISILAEKGQPVLSPEQVITIPPYGD